MNPDEETVCLMLQNFVRRVNDRAWADRTRKRSWPEPTPPETLKRLMLRTMDRFNESDWPGMSACLLEVRVYVEKMAGLGNPQMEWAAALAALGKEPPVQGV